MKNYFARPVFGALAVSAVALIPTLSQAAALEEVIVTATKRPVGLQDVPIAISVVGRGEIEKKGLTNLEDISYYIPNVHVAEAAGGTQLFIRGIGSGVNFGFEQSVGTFVDGVYYGRGRSARGKLLDLERVEVLKGPQAILFGKNTIAGAINITTAKPTEEFEAYIDASYRTELEGFGVTAMVSGPLSDNVRGRLVARKYSDNGYVENGAVGGDDGPQQDNMSIRGSLAWDVSEDLAIGLKLEHGQFEVLGRQQTIDVASPTATFFYQTFGDPNFVAGFNHETFDLGIPGSPQFDDTDNDLAQLTAEWSIGEGTLRSITAYTEYDFDNTVDNDYSPLAFIARSRSESHEQFSQEILWSSPTGGSFDYLAGAYYSTEEISHNRNTFVLFSGLPPVENSIFALLGGGFPSGALDGNGINTFNQDSDSFSVFAEGTWHISDSFRLTAGLRWSDDEKSMAKTGRLENVEGILPDALLANLYAGPLRLAGDHDYSLDRDETHTTGHVNLQWDISDDTMVYFNVSNGFKAGGFDEDNNLGRLDVAEFEDETVDSFEIGAKTTLADGRGNFNIAAFSSSYEDVQVSTFDGNAAFVVGNAAKTKVDGVEMDIIYALSDKWTIKGALSFLDARYDSFPGAACNVGQIQAAIAANGSRACVQDLSGKPLQFAPDFAANVGISYQTPITDALELDISADYNWSDDTVIANDQDENLILDSYGKLNAVIRVASIDEVWSLSLIGKNLTDETVFTWGNDVPLGSFGFDNTYFKLIDPPRTWEINGRYNF